MVGRLEVMAGGAVEICHGSSGTCRGGVVARSHDTLYTTTTTLYTAMAGAWGCCCFVDRTAPLGTSHGSPTPLLVRRRRRQLGGVQNPGGGHGGGGRLCNPQGRHWLLRRRHSSSLLPKNFLLESLPLYTPHPPSPEFKSSRVGVPRVVKSLLSLVSSTKSLARRSYFCSSSIADCGAYCPLLQMSNEKW